MLIQVVVSLQHATTPSVHGPATKLMRASRRWNQSKHSLLACLLGSACVTKRHTPRSGSSACVGKSHTPRSAYVAPVKKWNKRGSDDHMLWKVTKYFMTCPPCISQSGHDPSMIRPEARQSVTSPVATYFLASEVHLFRSLERFTRSCYLSNMYFAQAFLKQVKAPRACHNPRSATSHSKIITTKKSRHRWGRDKSQEHHIARFPREVIVQNQTFAKIFACYEKTQSISKQCVYLIKTQRKASATSTHAD